MVEEAGFEAATAKTKHGTRLNEMAEEVGFEPTVPCGTTVFKTAAFNHSAIPPQLHQDSISPMTSGRGYAPKANVP